MLQMFGIICAAVASSAAVAAGEFRAALWEAHFEGYLKKLIELTGDQPTNRLNAQRATDCNIDYVMQGFTPDEIARLDAWTTSGKSPGKELENRVIGRMTETVLKDVCPPPGTGE